ncbi:MAG TPA: hypothetical protein VG759_29035 [Candidatus Angelobacter sp.]|nr:hypothetical protein [Candidatus Angelobacter sp.]HEV2992514.1 hypothetical protein [Candidatus Angelobacter sp.]
MAFSAQLASKQLIAATEVMLCDGHSGTKFQIDYSLPLWQLYYLPSQAPIQVSDFN